MMAKRIKLINKNNMYAIVNTATHTPTPISSSVLINSVFQIIV